MAISSSGLGSNLDVNGIVSQLMNIERQPLVSIDRREVKFQSELTAFGTIKGALSAFQGTVRGLSELARFRTIRAGVSDTSVMGVSAAPTAVTGTYSVQVERLAQSQKLSSAVGYSDVNTTIGTGTLTFQFGKFDGGVFTLNSAKSAQTVTIDAAHSSLVGVRDAINTANIGVSASLVNDGSGNRLVLTSKDAGVNNSLKISVSGDGDTDNTNAAGLSQLSYLPDAAGPGYVGRNMTQSLEAQDAKLIIDGITVYKSSNTVTDAIQGVTMNLLKADAGVAKTLTVNKDTGGVKTAIESFVKAYNDVDKTLRDLTAYNPATKQGAVLLGDSTVRSIQSQLRGVFNAPLVGIGGSLTRLSQIGISFQKDGSLAVDANKLQLAMDSHFNDIAALFASVGTPTDSLISYSSATAATRSGTYDVTVSALAAQGRATGRAVAGLTVTAGVNDTLTLSVDGVAATVTLAAATYTADQLAAEIQSKVNGAAAVVSGGVSVTASQTGGVLSLTSNRYGSASVVSVSGGNARDGLFGLALGETPIETAGVDVAGTLNGAAATGSGQSMTGLGGNAVDGLKLQVMGGALGARGTVSFTRGYAYQLDRMVESMLVSKGTLDSRTEGLNRNIKGLNTEREVLGRRLEGIEKRYRAQFTALDTLMGKMSQTSNYLQQQLSRLPGVGGNNA